MTVVTVDAEDLVRRAGTGDRTAWTGLVDAYAGMIFSIARSHRLSEADATDVSQTTWLRLIEHLDRINDPSRVGAWLATTARRESLRVIGISSRQLPTGESTELEPRIRSDVELDAALLASERDARLQKALAQLPARCVTMLLLLTGDDALSYQEISERLGMPVGSIGPTRARCLQKLRVILDEMDAEDAEPAAHVGVRVQA
ncbi:MAG: RNA polymerase sigma factor [Actinomycetes bacterium]